jgi:hypothetical protein
MSEARDKLDQKASRLRDDLAAAEAVVTDIKTRLAKVEAKLTGEPPPQTGLDLLWTAALPTARTRSSKIQCRTEWLRIPVSARPPVKEVLTALKIWNRCDEWKKDGNSFVPGLHRWIKNRQWENLPEGSSRDPLARYRNPEPKPQAAISPEDQAAVREFLSTPIKKFIAGRD